MVSKFEPKDVICPCPVATCNKNTKIIYDQCGDTAEAIVDDKSTGSEVSYHFKNFVSCGPGFSVEKKINHKKSVSEIGLQWRSITVICNAIFFYILRNGTCSWGYLCPSGHLP